jgi:tRNA pseudouridine38-40 synthase
VNTVSFEQDNDNCIFTIEANRFIYKMVRSIVGTLIDIGREKCNSSLDNILALKDRRFAGMTAPPNGLVLENVQYREVLKYEEM